MGSSPTVVLVGCCGPKLDRRAPARDLYTSDLFKKARAFAERNGEQLGSWAILSAKHSLIFPDRPTDPYDLSLSSLTPGELESWLITTEVSLRYHAGCFGWRRAVVLAGEGYIEAVRRSGIPFETPLAGMQIGERLAWFKREAGLFADAAVSP